MQIILDELHANKYAFLAAFIGSHCYIYHFSFFSATFQHSQDYRDGNAWLHAARDIFYFLR